MTIDAIILVAKCTMTPLAIIGVLANLTVIIVFINCKIHTRSFAYTLVLQQAVIDMLGCCCYAVFSCVNGNKSSIACKTGVTIFYFILFASAYNLVLISIERYIAVVHPLKYWARGTQKKRLLPRLCIPFVSSLLTVCYVPIFVDVNEMGECFVENRRILISSSVLMSILGGVLPILIMLFCYRRVYVTLCEQSRTRTELTTKGSITQSGVESPTDAKQLRNEAERNFTTTMLINTVIYVIFDFLSMLIHIAAAGRSDDLRYYVIFSVLLLCNMVANPFVYAYKFTDYKKGFCKTFCCRDQTTVMEV
ncbi:histamine H2 receptor-like [Antedon mediterranea]|uniref:histamine H2 receptor-like n=1 Tax=Antedon mediterranea TaxID=105859 RepID=UPI003AF63F84